jgi:small subunit ribosomal protein S12
MPTLNQLVLNSRLKKIHKSKAPLLSGCPQKRAVCLKVRVMTPKKPNSAQRKVARVKLSNNIMLTGYIPGQGHNLQRFSQVLVQGGRANDLPGVRYSFIRGKFDFATETYGRSKSRSKYGLSKPSKDE